MANYAFESFGSRTLAAGDELLVTNVRSGSGMQIDVASGASATVYFMLTDENSFLQDSVVAVSSAFVISSRAYAMKIVVSGGVVTVGVTQ